MFKRLIPSKRCPRLNNISARNICGLTRFSSYNQLNAFNPHNHTDIHSCNTVSSSSPSPLYLCHSNRHKSIKVYNQPNVGEGTVEVDILEWLVKPGDKITPLQTIGRGKYEKADVDILAPTYNGTVHKIVVNAGDIAIVGKPIIEFEVDDDSTKTSATSTTSSTSTQTDNGTPSITSTTLAKQIQATSENILALPGTKRYAKENNVDLSHVAGTGKSGRILKEDVMEYLNNPNQKQSESKQQTITTLKQSKSPLTIQNKYQQKTDQQGIDYHEKIIGVKRAMVKKMAEANDVPQFGYGDEIIMNELVNLRSSLKSIGELYGIRITYLPFILKATSLSLLNYTSLNAHVNTDCTELIHRSSHNIGVAIDSPEGLIVPNIKNIENKTILEIARDLDELVVRGRNAKITNDDITGGTFSLSNIGAIGGTYCSPICFVPEVCIGALGTMKQFPRYNKTGELYKASVMAVSWSADHRVIDGATVARFSNQFKEYLENPSSMLLHLK